MILKILKEVEFWAALWLALAVIGAVPLCLFFRATKGGTNLID